MMRGGYVSIGIASILFLTLCFTASGEGSRRAPTPKDGPVLFAPGIISTDDDEFGGTFTPDGLTFYFAKKTQSTIRSSVIVICVSHFRDGNWTTPEVAPFSGRYKDFDPTISPDGSKLFFISNRPVNDKPKLDTDIWVVENTPEGQGDPKNLGPPVNSDRLELGCSVAANGTLYFSSARQGGKGSLDIYRSRLVDGKYTEPENLGDGVNTPGPETDPFIAPDESYLLFASQGRPDGLLGGGAVYARGDLYISYQVDGHWTPAKSLGPDINSVFEESNPFVSPDSKYLYFTSERNFTSVPMRRRLNFRELEAKLHGPGNGIGDIYRVEAAGIINAHAP